MRLFSFFIGFFLFFLLFVLQSSFLFSPNLSFYLFFVSIIALFLWLIFEDPLIFDGVFVAFFAGLFFDIFSLNQIGLFAFVFGFGALLIKFFLEKYVRISFTQRI